MMSRVDGSEDELVQLGVVRDEPHAHSIWLRDEEGGADPSCGNVDLGYHVFVCLLYTSPSPRDRQKSRMPSSA